MKKTIAFTAGGLLAYLSVTALVAHLALPAGTRRWVLIGILWLLGLIAAAVVVWFLSRRQKQGADLDLPGSDSGEIDALVREAEGKLAAARTGKIGSLPAIFLIGEQGSTKTSTVVHSGLDPELLAGQVYQENTVMPTPSANLWLAGRIVIAEFSGKLVDDAASWARLQRRLQPAKMGSVVGSGGQAPRAAVVCFDIELLARAGSGESAAASARKLRARLGEVAEKLGINLPVYALFTRMDRVPFFLEYVRNLSNDDIRQVLGVSLPLATLARGTGYAAQETTRLNQAFDDLARSLCDARPELLVREHEASLLPAVYEFPREFRKLRSHVVAFLTELCRPSQLTVGPFLRGFYFSGIRPVIVNEAAPAPRPVPQQEAAGAEIAATRMMRIGFSQPQQVASAAPQFAGTRKVPQWIFLSDLFERVLLQDRLAMGASGASTKTSTLRRVLLITASVLCLFFAIAWTVSFFKNRGLESDVRQAAAATGNVAVSGNNVASLEALQGLESLRQTLAVLSDYKRNGAPFGYRWGLYVGDDLYPQVYKLYFARFKQVLFAQTQDTMLESLRRLPGTPGPDTPPYSPTYDTLKAYLITTSNHDKSTRNFLSPVLLNRWSTGRNVAADRVGLAQKQFDFYSDELKLANPYISENDSFAVDKARRYLAQFGGFDRVYQAMLVDAAKNSPPINFNRQFPGTAEVVVNAKDVNGAFAKAGWDFMKNAVRNPDRYFSGEQWVLGDQGAINIDRANLEQRLQQRYYSDFLAQWRAYLGAGSVVKYKDLKDGAEKLNLISGNLSPLLSMLCLASQHVAVDEPSVAKAFQPVTSVEAAGCAERYIGPSNQMYMNSLVTLQASLEGAAQAPSNEAAAAKSMENATAARIAARQLAQTFQIDPEGHSETTVLALLLAPITNAEALLRSIGPAELNAKGKGLCTQMSAVWKKYPFNSAATPQATVADVNGLFRKPDGALWALYDSSLQKLLVKQGNNYVANPSGGVAITPAFVNFFNQAAALSDALYAGNTQDPHFNYSLKPLPSEGISNLTINVTLDGNALTYAGGQAPAKQVQWQAADPHGFKATLKLAGNQIDWIEGQGLWAVFHFFDQAERVLPGDSGQILEWIIRAGKDPMKVDGKPVTIRFQVDMGSAPPLFQKGYFARLGCVSEIAKP